MAGYSTRVRSDIARWRQAGLIDAATSDRLTRDVEANERTSFSFGSILAMMAALLFGAAILIFVAANWDAIPRLARVAALFAIILAGYVGGALLKTRDHAAIGEALWIVASAAFGGSIALIGQMYHLSGDEASAVVTWGAGTALAAVALRSNALTVASVGIADTWLFLKGFDYYHGVFPHFFVVMAAVLFAISFWTRSQAARHLIILSLLFYLTLLVMHHETLPVAIPLVVASALLFAASVFAPEPVDRIVQLGGRLPLHALLGFLTGLAMIQFALADESTYNSGFAVASVVALAGIVAAIVLAGRESRGLRWLAYLGFAFELAIIYVVTLQSMLDTAGFFLAAAVLLGILAIIIIRVEKRMKGPTGATA
ncbi:MAG: DUF2157 domain-containing protein [Mesorhizobium sp.]|nr:DUF2157 domain-containing protein [bacterium M00.F.Ca.ET.205.01.1.1]TGU47502.1 DUF2157 domain-containing protein [bacterium M00.F.Ca.ET.152.01.1.1]TGV32203.1 DUF2157 domain-containing protein [Mesorhizobium sp. M00.F.Ca.ET.186.01.1.1]TGZ39278.1 DUF2157 domain-containing protein [bacterium M00.F.Ca.ET.162.01.1.1]TIW60795.1 MAG: DUF2157 domain-containing protein [Mesorhizobium sp.]